MLSPRFELVLRKPYPCPTMGGLLALGLALAGAVNAWAQVPATKLFIDPLDPSSITNQPSSYYTTETNYGTNVISTAKSQQGNVTVGGNTWLSINNSYLNGMNFINGTQNPGIDGEFYQPSYTGAEGTNSDGTAPSNGGTGTVDHYLYSQFLTGQPVSSNPTYGVQSIWLVSPLITVKNGSVVTFWTKGSIAQNGAQGGDQLLLKFSTSSSANFDIGTVSNGSTNTSYNYTPGDFTKTLLDINPSELPDGLSGDTSTGTSTANEAYPTTWTQYSVTITGLTTTAANPTGAVTGRFGFDYLVTHANGGQDSGYGDDIGIDDFSVNAPEPSSIAMLLSGAIVGVGVWRWRHGKLEQSIKAVRNSNVGSLPSRQGGQVT